MNASFDAKRFPVLAVAWLEHQPARGPVFCPDSWGGYLIYQAFPDLKAVVDDRHDLYGAEYFKQYLKIMRVEPGWDEGAFGNQSRMDAAAQSVIGRDASATGTRPGVLLYSDETAIMFKKATSKRSCRKREFRGVLNCRVPTLNPTSALTSMGSAPLIAGLNFQEERAARTREVPAPGSEFSTCRFLKEPLRSRTQAITMRARFVALAGRSVRTGTGAVSSTP